MRLGQRGSNVARTAIARGLTELAERGLWGGLKTAVPSAIETDRTVTVLSEHLRFAAR
jgi:hypothetical protein